MSAILSLTFFLNLSTVFPATVSYLTVQRSCRGCTLVTADCGSHCVPKVFIHMEMMDCFAMNI